MAELTIGLMISATRHSSVSSEEYYPASSRANRVRSRSPSAATLQRTRRGLPSAMAERASRFRERFRGNALPSMIREIGVVSSVSSQHSRRGRRVVRTGEVTFRPSLTRFPSAAFVLPVIRATVSAHRERLTLRALEVQAPRSCTAAGQGADADLIRPSTR